MNSAYQHDQNFHADEISAAPALAGEGTWKVMIVVENWTRCEAVRDEVMGFGFPDRSLDVLCATSATDAEQLIQEHPDTAVILVDVDVESDAVGLDFVRFVRDVADDHNVRIIVRENRSGAAIDRRLISVYDVSEHAGDEPLTGDRLFIAMHSALKAYRNAVALQSNKRALEQVIDATSTIFERRSMGLFAQGVLEQLTTLIYLDQGGDAAQTSGIAAICKGPAIDVVAGTGRFADQVGIDRRPMLPRQVLEDFETAIKDEGTVRIGDRVVRNFRTRSGLNYIVYLTDVATDDAPYRHLIEVFARNVGVAFENIQMNEEHERAQREMIYRLGEAVETRSRETGNHVRRVAEISKVLAVGYGLGPEEAQVLRAASPLHDVGMIGVPDTILNKPGKLESEEWGIVQNHALLGYAMLKDSEHELIRAGATIAQQHHEKWDGSGYPAGKAGEEIHIFGRITAVADVFDALGCDRPYKKAWPLDDVIAHMRAERGKHFDPKLVDVLMEHLKDVLEIRDRFADKFTADQQS